MAFSAAAEMAVRCASVSPSQNRAETASRSKATRWEVSTNCVVTSWKRMVRLVGRGLSCPSTAPVCSAV